MREPYRLPVSAQLVVTVVGDSEEEVRAKAGRLLVARDGAARIVEMLGELLGDDLPITRVWAVDLRADWPAAPPPRHVVRREGTVWVVEDEEWEDVPGEVAERAFYLTGRFSARWSGPEGEHEPGPQAETLDAVLGWALWRAPRVLVEVPDQGRYSAGEAADADLAPLPADGLRLVRRPSPESMQRHRAEDDPPLA